MLLDIVFTERFSLMKQNVQVQSQRHLQYGETCRPTWDGIGRLSSNYNKSPIDANVIRIFCVNVNPGLNNKWVFPSKFLWSQYVTVVWVNLLLRDIHVGLGIPCSYWTFWWKMVDWFERHWCRGSVGVERSQSFEGWGYVSCVFLTLFLLQHQSLSDCFALKNLWVNHILWTTSFSNFWICLCAVCVSDSNKCMVLIKFFVATSKTYASFGKSSVMQ